MSDKINEPNEPNEPFNFGINWEVNDSDLPFPPTDDTDSILDGAALPPKPPLPPVSPVPPYKSPFIRGTGIPVADTEAVLMALINGDIQLGDIKNTIAQGSEARISRAEARASLLKAKQEAIANATMEAKAQAKIKAELALGHSKVVFHNVPSGGKDEADIAAYRALQGVPIRLCTVPDATAFETLRKEFPWMLDSIQYLDDSCDMARRGNSILRFSPLLLLGTSGVGKTSLVRRFCELSNIPYILLSAGGSSDSMMIKGLHRSWSSARPGIVIDCIKQHNVANPIIIVDEIDKVGTSSHNGNFTDSLIQMLEPSSAAIWTDEFLQGRVDLSSVNFVLTANDITKLSSPLLSRIRAVNVDYLSQKDLMYAIPQIVAEIAGGYGIAKSLIPEMDSRIAEAMSRKCRDLRKLKQAVQSWLLVAVKQEDKHLGHTLH
jgi:hypothetical protein